MPKNLNNHEVKWNKVKQKNTPKLGQLTSISVYQGVDRLTDLQGEKKRDILRRIGAKRR